MQLTTLYRQMLSYAKYRVSDDGLISYMDGKPAMLDDRRMVLPTKEHLTGFDPNKKMIFHPLAENISRTESDLLKRYRRSINIMLNFSIGWLGTELLELVQNKDQHQLMTPHQGELLRKMVDVPNKAVTDFSTLITKATAQDATSVFVSSFVQRGGELRKERWFAVGVVRFPLYEKIVNENENMSLSKEKRRCYQRLLEFMFPGIDDPLEPWSVGGRSVEAPVTDVLMRSTGQLAERINELIDLYENFLPKAAEFRIDTECLKPFHEGIDNYRAMIRSVPMVSQNTESVSPVPTAAPPATAAFAKAPQAPAVKPNASGKVSMQELLAKQPALVQTAAFNAANNQLLHNMLTGVVPGQQFTMSMQEQQQTENQLMQVRQLLMQLTSQVQYAPDGRLYSGGIGRTPEEHQQAIQKAQEEIRNLEQKLGRTSQVPVMMQPQMMMPGMMPPQPQMMGTQQPMMAANGMMMQQPAMQMPGMVMQPQMMAMNGMMVQQPMMMPGMPMPMMPGMMGMSQKAATVASNPNNRMMQNGSMVTSLPNGRQIVST